MILSSAQEPVANRFVVKPAETASKESRLAFEAMGPSSELGDSGLRVVQLSPASNNPKAAWQALLDTDPSLEWAAPVLIDQDQQAHFPTGDVSVRFDRAPSEEDLECFAATHRVRLVSHNEFVPEQVALRPLRPREEYLPELVRAIADSPGVRAAWANTSSRYRRT